MAHRITITTRATIAYTGAEHVDVQQYEIERSGMLVDRFSCNILYMGKRGSMAYGVSRLRDLRVEQQKGTDGRALSISSRMKDEDDRKARIAVAAPALAWIVEAFSLFQSDWEAKVWAEVAADSGGVLLEYVGDARGVALRKMLRPLMTEAKQNARDEYPEDYRELDDKDDFYERYADDIANHITSNL